MLTVAAILTAVVSAVALARTNKRRDTVIGSQLSPRRPAPKDLP